LPIIPVVKPTSFSPEHIEERSSNGVRSTFASSARSEGDDDELRAGLMSFPVRGKQHGGGHNGVIAGTADYSGTEDVHSGGGDGRRRRDEPSKPNQGYLCKIPGAICKYSGSRQIRFFFFLQIYVVGDVVAPGEVAPPPPASLSLARARALQCIPCSP
jgi:hypothetical protein